MTAQSVFEGNVTLNDLIQNYERRTQEVDECFRRLLSRFYAQIMVEQQLFMCNYARDLETACVSYEKRIAELHGEITYYAGGNASAVPYVSGG